MQAALTHPNPYPDPNPNPNPYPDPYPNPNPNPNQVGANVPFIAHVRQGGTITCDEERDADWDPETADRPGTLP